MADNAKDRTFETAELPEYRVEAYVAEIPVPEYMESCVDIPTFLGYCEACPNYEKTWACPPFDFSVQDFWLGYRSFYMSGKKIVFDTRELGRKYAVEDFKKFSGQILKKESHALEAELIKLETQYPGSVALSMGSCDVCGEAGCTRPLGEPCRRPERMRHSVESVGGNVGLSVKKYLKQEIQWMSEERLPDYFILMGGLLKK